MDKTLLIALLTGLLILGLYIFAQTSSINTNNDQEQNSIIVSPTPIPSGTTTDSFRCDTDVDCAVGTVCREAQMCPPCLTDSNNNTVGDCKCVTVKKCEPK